MNNLIQPLLIITVLNIVMIAAGYRLVQLRNVLSGWLFLLIGITVIYFTTLHCHPILRMLALIATTFTGMKVVAATEAYKQKHLRLNFKQWFVFAAGWAGMRPHPFETFKSAPLPGGTSFISYGISRLVVGAVLIFLAHQVVKLPLNNHLIYFSVSAILLVALSLILHFGLLSISAGMWRFSGVDTYLLFRQPAMALSLTELWSKRWNLAFSEMAAIAVFRPLVKRIGAGGALMATFLFSGLLHEIALSLPVNSGYGLPTLYFVIQGLLVLLEKQMQKRKITLLQNQVVAKVWLFFWLVVPMPLLFHATFINEVVWPLAGLSVHSLH